MENPKFEVFAVVELFGHSRIAGKVQEQTIGGASFIRVDVPQTESQPPFTRLLNPSAIYAINPVTEELANRVAQSIEVKPVTVYDVNEAARRLMALKAGHEPAGATEGLSFDGEEDDDEDDDLGLF